MNLLCNFSKRVFLYTDSDNKLVMLSYLCLLLPLQSAQSVSQSPVPLFFSSCFQIFFNVSFFIKPNICVCVCLYFVYFIVIFRTFSRWGTSGLFPRGKPDATKYMFKLLQSSFNWIFISLQTVGPLGW